MKPKLHLVLGPTTTGKTNRAVSLALESGAPVVAIDRIQCHSELTVGSGRPSEQELQSTRRLYLCERPVAAGELPPCEANQLLHELVTRLGRSESFIILEGGSVSLLRAMAVDPAWAGYEWSMERLHLSSADVFNARASIRVREMLADGARPSMLDECAALWPDACARSTLMGVVGYRTIAHYAQARGKSVDEFAGAPSVIDLDRLTCAIVDDAFTYAQHQESELPLYF